MNASLENGSEQPTQNTPGEPFADAAHIPFRAWALQQDFGSVLGWRPVPTWGSRPHGLDGVTEPSDWSGQAFLHEALVPDPDYELRARTGTQLLALAAVLCVLSVLNPLQFRVANEDLSWACVVISAVASFADRLPAEVADRARESIAFVQQGAVERAGADGASLVAQAEQAFVDGSNAALLTGAGVLLLAAAYVFVRAPRTGEQL